jgi:hypothetical protein
MAKISGTGVSHDQGDEPDGWPENAVVGAGNDISPHDPLARLQHVPPVADPTADPYEKSVDTGTARAGRVNDDDRTESVRTSSADAGSRGDSDTDDSHEPDQSRVDEVTGVPTQESDESSTAIRSDEPVRITPHDDRTAGRPVSE